MIAVTSGFMKKLSRGMIATERPRFVRTLAKRIGDGSDSLTEVRPVLEFVARSYHPAMSSASRRKRWLGALRGRVPRRSCANDKATSR
jgi:hypothetical protein